MHDVSCCQYLDIFERNTERRSLSLRRELIGTRGFHCLLVITGSRLESTNRSVFI